MFDRVDERRPRLYFCFLIVDALEIYSADCLIRSQRAARFHFQGRIKVPIRAVIVVVPGISRESVLYGHGERTVMSADSSSTDNLLRLAGQADRSALAQLLDRYRLRLRRMVAARLDRRIAARVDASDIVQETLADAARRLPEYIRDRPMPYWVWLQRLAVQRLIW